MDRNQLKQRLLEKVNGKGPVSMDAVTTLPLNPEESDVTLQQLSK